jgi:hypothetical protein
MTIHAGERMPSMLFGEQDIQLDNNIDLAVVGVSSGRH